MKFTDRNPKIIVIGSSSIDLVLKTDHHPHPNETVMANEISTIFGGKGANQAIGVSRLGGEVYFLSRVGSDKEGAKIVERLESQGVNTDFVIRDKEHLTGRAFVTSADGMLKIIVAPGAGNFLSEQEVDAFFKVVKDADVVLTQLETGDPLVEYIAGRCADLGIRLGLYASPGRVIRKKVLDSLSFLVAKSTDMAAIFGKDSQDDALKRMPNRLFIRDAMNSTIYFNGHEMKFFREDHGKIKDTMGMGDAFTSGFTIALSHGNTLEDCVRFGNKVAAKVAEQEGSQAGLPHLREVAE